jgi:hypothetical protein
MMKRLLLALLFLSALARAGTTTLTGTIKDAQGNPLNGKLAMWLPVPAQDPNTNTGIMPTPVYFRLVNGVVTGGAPLYDVLTINPSGLYYVARAYDQAGNLQFYGNYVVTGASFNLGQAVPTSVTTSNISYLSPGFTNGNNTWTGTNTFTLGAIFQVSGSGCSKSLQLQNVDVAPTNPNKYFRVNQSTGALEIMSNGCGLIASLTDAGALTIPGTITASLGAVIGGGAPLTCNTSNCSGTSMQLTLPQLNGVIVSGTPSAGQALVATSPTAASWSSVAIPIQQHYSTTTIVNSTIGAGPTTVFSIAVTMPSSGCPCRIEAAWWAYLAVSNSGQDVAYVTDGTNSWAAAETATPGSASGFGFSAAGTSPTTYANSATPTITLKGGSSHAGSTTYSTSPAGITVTGSPASALVLDVIPSN